MSTGGSAAPAPDLHCSLTAPASVAVGQPVPLRFTLANRGAAAVQVLEWGTPLEGWFGAMWRWPERRCRARATGTCRRR